VFREDNLPVIVFLAICRAPDSMTPGPRRRTTAIRQTRRFTEVKELRHVGSDVWCSHVGTLASFSGSPGGIGIAKRPMKRNNGTRCTPFVSTRSQQQGVRRWGLLKKYAPPKSTSDKKKRCKGTVKTGAWMRRLTLSGHESTTGGRGIDKWSGRSPGLKLVSHAVFFPSAVGKLILLIPPNKRENYKIT